MAAHENHEDKYIACASVVPDCPFEATASNEEELLKKVAAHAAHDHGIADVTPELLAKVKAAIQNR
jgi:predicted small metal-binding protein